MKIGVEEQRQMGRFGLNLLIVLSLVIWLQPGYTAASTHDVPTSLSQQATPLPQPTPTGTTTEQAPTRPLGYTTMMALVCLFMLSVVTLAGSIAMKRRFDAISPDRS